MSILLDSGPLGLVSNPKGKPIADSCKAWLKNLIENDVQVCLPEIADYEVRRELVRAKKTQGINRLDSYKNTLLYLPISTPIMLRAAQFWAQARQQGFPTAHEHALDGDVILAAYAALLSEAGHDVTIATTNVKHLERFVPAKTWQDIRLFDSPSSDINNA